MKKTVNKKMEDGGLLVKKKYSYEEKEKMKASEKLSNDEKKIKYAKGLAEDNKKKVYTTESGSKYRMLPDPAKKSASSAVMPKMTPAKTTVIAKTPTKTTVVKKETVQKTPYDRVRELAKQKKKVI